MAIPGSRHELIEQLTRAYQELAQELDKAGPPAAKLICVDDWSVRDLLAVRAWWTEQVVAWIDAGRNEQCPTTPAAGYKWNETPRLNADIVRTTRRQSYRQVRNRLEQGVQRVFATIESLQDAELLEPGAFAWAGKWPLSRWIAINTVRQYVTARTYVRRAVRRHKEEETK